MDSPIGQLRIWASDAGLTGISLNVDSPDSVPPPNRHTLQATVQLEEYFEGDREEFELDLAAEGTAFMQAVWGRVAAIPYGETRSYLELARELDNPGAVRAVGMANGRNPLPIIIPCHRVIGSDGSLTGYALGLDIKRRLLALENPKRQWAQQGSLF